MQESIGRSRESGERRSDPDHPAGAGDAADLPLDPADGGPHIRLERREVRACIEAGVAEPVGGEPERALGIVPGREFRFRHPDEPRQDGVAGRGRRR